MKYIAVLAFAMFYSWPLFSQDLVVHLPNTITFSGDDMYFSVIPDKRVADKSIALRASLVDQNGNTIVSKFVEINRKHDFFLDFIDIPNDIFTGNYNFALFAFDKSNMQEQVINSTLITILNLDEDFSQHQEISSISDENLPQESISKTEDYMPESSIKFLSIAHKELGPKTDVYSIDVSKTWSRDAYKFFKIYSVSEVGELLKKQPKLLTFYLEKQHKFVTAIGSEDGFLLEVPEFSGKDYISVFDPNNLDAIFEIKEIQSTYDYDWSVPNFEKTGFHKDIVDKKRKELLIADHFGSKPLALNRMKNEKISLKNEDFYDARINAREYVNFRHVGAFLSEVFTMVKKKKENGREVYKMYDNERRGYYGTTVFLIDDKLETDVDNYTSIPFEQVEYIDLFFNTRSLQTEFNSSSDLAVVRITTKDSYIHSSDDVRTFEINGYQAVESVSKRNELKGPNFSNVQFLGNPKNQIIQWNDRLGLFEITNITKEDFIIKSELKLLKITQ